MVDEVRIGTNWRNDELDAIVADYFAMLTDELSGQPYVKSRYSKALTAKIGRPHGSAEFKHQNISAVLDELGMPWIRGYKPRKNYRKLRGNFLKTVLGESKLFLIGDEDVLRKLGQ